MSVIIGLQSCKIHFSWHIKKEETYKNGTIEIEQIYKNDIFWEGNVIHYYKNGQISKQGNYKDGLVNGKSFSNYENGAKIEINLPI